MLDFRKIEKKWQEKWEKAKVFETNVDKKKRKFFTSNVIPYVNGNMHIGHSYTYTRTDVYARYKRMQGFNTLFAQGFHATGEPIVGAVERLRNGDQSQLETYKLYGVSDKEIEGFKKKGPLFVANYWAEKISKNLRDMGFSIDWRRKFTLSITPQFSKFVEWQYNTLRKKGYVTQGTHPVVWCPHDQSPTGDHDRLLGEGESPVEFTLIKFRMGDAFLPAATLRPETIYGVTNIWLNPNADYVEAKVNDEKWVVSKHAVEKIKDHIKDVKILKEFDELHQLFGRRCVNPVTGKELSILPGDFVNANTATGVVMSVPAHAPFDWIALKEFIDKNQLEAYGVNKSEMEPPTLIKSEGFGENPARQVSEKLGITTTAQKDLLDEATSILYKKEYHTGVLNENCGPYAGLKVSEVKEKIIGDFIEKGISEVFYDVNDVVCRCTTKCHVKILENQWFLKYSDEKWKTLAKKCLNKMSIYPEEARNNFIATIDWLKDKACARKSGLGTKLPWDKEWIVETLSDSTVYMAYYTISGVINKYKISEKVLADEVFDFVFLGKGDPKKIAKKGGIKLALLKSMKEEFDYFYPYDFRNSAKELVQNHLTFFIFQHTALWPESKWPKCIAVNGFVNVEGDKMSKSLGNIIPLSEAIANYGADMVRINIASANENMDDADWRIENLKGIRIRYDFLYKLIKDIRKCKRASQEAIDSYILSRLQKTIKTATENYEVAKFRTATQYALFESTNEIRWYITRCGGIGNANAKTLKEALSIVVRMLAPLSPHVCEEMWSMLGNKGFVSIARFPEYDAKKIDAGIEQSEEFVKQALDDIREIQKLLTAKPKKISIFVADSWKFDIYKFVLKNKAMSMNETIKSLMATDARRYGDASVAFVQSLYKKINELRAAVPRSVQFETLNEAKQFLEGETGAKIEITDASTSRDKKARAAVPQKPGILLE